MRKSGGYYDVLLGHVVQREGAQCLQLKKEIEIYWNNYSIQPEESPTGDKVVNHSNTHPHSVHNLIFYGG